MTGTRRVGWILARKPGNWWSRAMAKSRRDVAAWATRELANPQETAVATAVST